MTPGGKVVGEIRSDATEAQVFAALRKALQAAPEFARPAPGEEKLQGVALAELRLDLGDLDGAARALAGVKGGAGAYLRGHVARLQGDWDAMEQAFALVDGEALADDVEMERAHRMFLERKFAELEKALQEFPEKSNRLTEARYYLGLAKFHQGKKDDAIAVWAETIQAHEQDRWIYRADWALCDAKKSNNRVMFTTADKRTSQLNRIGYSPDC